MKSTWGTRDRKHASHDVTLWLQIPHGFQFPHGKSSVFKISHVFPVWTPLPLISAPPCYAHSSLATKPLSCSGNGPLALSLAFVSAPGAPPRQNTLHHTSTSLPSYLLSPLCSVLSSNKACPDPLFSPVLLSPQYSSPDVWRLFILFFYLCALCLSVLECQL